MGGEGRAARALLLPYVVEGLLAALLHLVDPCSEDGQRQISAYRVRGCHNINFPEGYTVMAEVMIVCFHLHSCWRPRRVSFELFDNTCQLLVTLIVKKELWLHVEHVGP